MDAPLSRFHAQARELCRVAMARLPRMIDPATGLVVFRVEGQELTPRGASVRYTAMTALGLERAERSGLGSPIDLDRLDEALAATLAGVDNVGDVGLVLWATAPRARAVAERALRFLAEFPENVAARRSRMVHSTELALCVAGLAQALAADVGPEREVRALLDRAFAQLMAQRGASGLLPFARPAPSARDRAPRLRCAIEGELGFFDAQVYAIVAALKRDEVLDDPEARRFAAAIGRQILAHQRPLGQWPWHYNARTGAMVDVYPVYSVHQDGMAPMALLPLEGVCGLETTPAVARGVAWLFGHNELAEPLAIPERALIWRSLRRRQPLDAVVYPLKAASALGLGRRLDLGARLADPRGLEIDRELRPYHLGFCLYAFAELAAGHPEATEDEAESQPRPTRSAGSSNAPGVRGRASKSA